MANRLTGNEDLTPEFIAALMRGDFGDQTSMFAGMRADPWVDARYGNPGNLSPDILAQIAAGTSPDYFVGHGGYSAPDNSGNTEAQMVPSWVIGQKLTDPNWGTARWQTWDLGGNYLGYGSADSDLRRLAKAVAVAAGAYYGAGAMSGAEGAGGAAGGAAGAEGAAGGAGAGAGADWAGWAAGEGSGALAGSGYTGADFLAGEAAAAGGAGAAGAGAAGAAGGSGSTGTSAATKAGTSAATTAATQGGGQSGASGASDFRQGEINGYQTNGSMPSSPASTSGNMSDWDRWWEAAKQAVGTGAGSDPASWGNLLSNFIGNNAGGLLGAYLGYQDSKDKQQTSKTEPWGPMQPYLLGLANGGADLYGQFKAQPFSPAEQTAYSNYGNVLDFINHAAPDLMSGFDANASGRNQFVRGQPRTLLGSNYTANGNPVAWQPGLLGGFGTGNNPRR